MAELAVPARYPIQFEAEYAAEQARWKALLRIPLSIPVLVFSYLLQNTVILAIWATILVRGRIPRWLFDFEVAVNRWQARMFGYFLLLTDVYPAFEGDYPIRYEVQYPERLSRWRLVVWKLITALPHFLVLAVLWPTLVFVTLIAWFAILIAGRYPPGLHGYVTGVLRWGHRVAAYVTSLTDEFPPFSLSPEAGRAGNDTYLICSVLGVIGTAAIISGITALAVISSQSKTVTVSYADLIAGDVAPTETLVRTGALNVELSSAADPGDELVPFLQPLAQERFVIFRVTIVNLASNRDLRISRTNFHLKDSAGDRQGPQLAIANGRVPPAKFEPGATVQVDLVFEVPFDEDPVELRYNPSRFEADSVVYKLE